MGFDIDRTSTWHAYGKLAPDEADGTPSFIDRLAARFPEVVDTIAPAKLGIPNMVADALKLATREAILRHDWPVVSAHLDFIDEVLQKADTSLHEAIGNSYLATLFYDETSIDFAKARTLLPKRLAAALEIMERHYEELRR